MVQKKRIQINYTFLCEFLNFQIQINVGFSLKTDLYRLNDLSTSTDVINVYFLLNSSETEYSTFNKALIIEKTHVNTI